MTLCNSNNLVSDYQKKYCLNFCIKNTHNLDVNQLKFYESRAFLNWEPILKRKKGQNRTFFLSPSNHFSKNNSEFLENKEFNKSSLALKGIICKTELRERDIENAKNFNSNEKEKKKKFIKTNIFSISTKTKRKESRLSFA